MMALTLRSFFLLCAISGALCGGWNQFSQDNSCPKGWLRLGSQCYVYKPDLRTFADAERVCKTVGGNLVSIHNVVENAVVLELVRQSAISGIAWLGLQDAISDNAFLWTDGTVVDFKAFGEGEPDNTGNCVAIFAGNGFWKDESCDLEAPYVCIQDAKFCSSYYGNFGGAW
ncbi:lithostathine-1-beta-like isoform X2 [Vanacampus margaritifer]